MFEFLANKFENPPGLRACSYSDRLNFKYTPMLFAMITALTTLASPLIGDPIDCWTPEYFTSKRDQ